MVALALVYIALATLGCVLLATPLPRLRVRAAMVVVLPAVAFAVWQASQPPTGWPATKRPDRNGQLVGGYIREPDALSHDRGEIDLLVVPPGARSGRLFRVPYSRQTHIGLQAALRAAKAGIRVGVRMTHRPQGEPGPRVVPQFYRLPPPALPSKG